MNKKRPLICLTTGSSYAPDKPEEVRKLILSRAYSEAIAAAGGLPVLCGEYCPQELAEACDALVLTGGKDLEPSLYHQEKLNDTVKCDPERDRFEMAVAKAFLDEKKPILTICRGFQLLNVLLGGDLYQDLVEQKGLVHFDKELRHPVNAAVGSVLANIYGERFPVNSTHHQAVNRLGVGLKATAWSDEGIIEAYEHESLPIIGTQFHPERLTGSAWDDRTPDFKDYFRYFVKSI